MMNARTTQRILAVCVLAAAAAFGQARAAALKVGDPAPKLQVSKWAQGEPVKEFAKDKVYIVEFWATWCGPCRASIPHVNELQVKFKDKGLIVIGQNVWEQDESKVAPFIEKMGDKMTYRVALDLVPEGEKSGKMAKTWMEAAGQNGIPAAFLVDKQGTIVWIGHPMELKESAIEQVLAGTFDSKKAAAEQEEKAKSQQALAKLARQLGGNMKEKEWDKAETTLSEMEKLIPAGDRAGLGMVRIQILLAKEDYKGAFKLADGLSEANKTNAMLQNQLAWDLATKEGIKERDLDVVERIAIRANDAANSKNPAILDTLARIEFMKGKEEKAIELQQKAVKLAEGDMKDQLQDTLDSYMKGKLPKAE